MGVTQISECNPIHNIKEKTLLVKATCFYLERLLLQKWRGNEVIKNSAMTDIDKDMMFAKAKDNATIIALLQLFCESTRPVTMDEIDKQIKTVKETCIYLERILLMDRKRAHVVTHEAKGIRETFALLRQLENCRIICYYPTAALEFAQETSEREAEFFRKCAEMEAKYARDHAEMEARERGQGEDNGGENDNN